MKIKARILLGLLCVGMSSHAFSHGYFTNGRAKLCADGDNTNCGAVQFEPQSIEGPGGFPAAGPADRKIASGGSDAWPEINEQTADRWTRVDFNSGMNTLRWKLTASHRTTDWQYFITKQNWNPNQPLTRDAFVLEPFCVVNDNNQVPPDDVEHQCDVPARTGYQIIFGAWNIGDTDQSFYQIIDAQFPSAPQQLELSVASIDVGEGDGTADVAVTLSGNNTDPVTVSLATSEGSAERGKDFYGVFQVLEFEPGQVTSVVPVTLVDDFAEESDEQFSVRLFNASGADIVDGDADVTIKDDDEGTSAFSIAVDDVTEGDSINVTVTLSSALGQESSVNIASAPLTADRGQDFYGIFATLTFAAGETSKTIDIETLDDSEAESSETLQLRLFAAQGADASDVPVEVTINDND